MNLLPKNISEFSSIDYWTDFFSNKNAKEFEWYADYLQIEPLLDRLIKNKENIKFLNIGCGNSTLGYDLLESGYLNIINIDLNQLVINQMQTKYKNYLNDKFKFMKMDIFNLEFNDSIFDIVLDKGTLDAIATDSTESTINKINEMFNQIEKVLVLFGRYMCISLLQEHVLLAFINWITKLSKFNYIIRIYRLKRNDLDNELNSKSFPVFMIVATKLKPKIGNQDKLLYELCLNEDYDCKPLRTLDQTIVIDLIKEIHNYNLIQNHIKNNSLDEELSFDLYDDDNINEYKYKFIITEQFNRDNKLKFAIFMVPLGREKEYLFSTIEGRKTICKLSGVQRLCFVILNANYKNYPNQTEDMHNELSPKVMDFAPRQYYSNANQKVPFLTIKDQEREILFRGKSDFSGEYIVCDVKTDENGKDTLLRQLIFNSNKQLIQSECKLKQIKRKKKLIKVVDHSYLACLHHGAIISGICLFKYFNNHLDNNLEDNLNNLSLNSSLSDVLSLKILLIGLGGGCLSSFLQHNLKLDNLKIEFDVVEIDETMLDISKKWFDLNEQLKEDKFKLNIYIEDGLNYLNRFKDSNYYDIIIFDIDNKSVNNGLSCPPAEFMEQKTLDNIKRILKLDRSLFILNLAARNNTIKRTMENRLRSNFKQLNKYRIPDEINTVYYCFTSKLNLNQLIDKDQSLSDRIKKFIELFKLTINKDELSSIIDPCDFVNQLTHLN